MGLQVPAALCYRCKCESASMKLWATALSPHWVQIDGCLCSTIYQFICRGHAVMLFRFTDDRESSITSFQGLWNDHTAAPARCDLRQDRWLFHSALGRPQLCGTHTPTKPCWQAMRPRNKRQKMAARGLL